MDSEKIHNLKAHMSLEKPQFDVNLGGRYPLVYGVDIAEFASSRQQEIDALTLAVENPQSVAQVFQNLPRHMRRRVMGHSSKRLPRLLRQAHQHQLEKSGVLNRKKPNRKYKRRPQSVLQAFNRRQREFVWLETHLWHAKRFHMVQRWGYKLAHFPNDKSFRACYRATSRHCMLQDVSFFCCVELAGPLHSLLDGLRHLTRPECGLTFAAEAFLSGSREGIVTVFHKGRFPYGAVGNVSFLWKPPESGTEPRTLWMWIHPASYQELVDELTWTFELKPRETVEVEERVKRPGKNVEQTKLATRNVPFLKTPKYQNDGGVEMVLLKDTLNRFRLTGPLSQAVLNEALLVIRDKDTVIKFPSKAPVKPKPNITNADIDDIFDMAPSLKPAKIVVKDFEEEELNDDRETKENDWWTKFYSSNPFHKSSLNCQREFWDSLKGTTTPAELPPNMVVGLTIVDPRLYLPSKRTKAVPENQSLRRRPVSQPRPGTCASAIWSSAVRDEATQTKPSVAELNRAREGHLVPGFLEEERGEVCVQGHHSRIPVVLIQRPGGQRAQRDRIGFGCGWDVVVPAGWAMPLWMALVLRGARPSGLREAEGLGREMCRVEALEPDSMAGRREIDRRREELRETHFRYPPAKRPNFQKLGISSPFSPGWDTLTREWSQPPSIGRRNPSECCSVSMLGPYFVLRDRAQLAALRDAVDPKRRARASRAIPEVPRDHRNCLVPVVLTMIHRGTPEDFSIVCVPTEEDLRCLASDPKYNGPVEPQHEDPNEQQRRDLRKEHKALLKRQRKQRVRAKRKREEGGRNEEKGDETQVEVKKKKPNEPADVEAATKYREMDQHLWVPEFSPVKDFCGRLTIGFVSKGDFSLSKGFGAGVGYIPLPALVLLMTKQSCNESKLPVYVLVRNPTSYQYYFAKLQINCPI